MAGINLRPGETIEASSVHRWAGSIGWFGMGVHNAYDLYLIRLINGNYSLVIYMKIQFIFKNSTDLIWNDVEKIRFTKDFENAITTTWGRSVLKTLASGKNIFVEFRFNSIIEGWSVSEHWEIHVEKIKKGAFKQSFVNPRSGKISMDSEDLTPTNKGYSKPQRGVVHEFGHMLGLDDEYTVGTPYEKDYQSIMNRGETVLSRHRIDYMQWLDQIIKDKGWK